MDLARRNAEENQVSDRIWVGTAEEVPAGEVDVVITNPPIRAGKAVIYDLFRKSYDWLAPTGRLYVVIRKNQGAPSAVKEPVSYTHLDVYKRQFSRTRSRECAGHRGMMYVS